MIVHCILLLIGCSSILRGAVSSSRIVGGTTTTIEQYPYQISLQREGNHICGGSIFSNLWVLTAAHCIRNQNHALYTVRSGSTFYDSGGKVSSVKRIIVHEKFNETSVDYDIAAVQLNRSLVLNTQTVPIPIALQSDVFRAGTLVTVTGWGRMSVNGRPSRRLQKVDVPLVSWSNCSKLYEERITERMICAGVPNIGGKDACQGDSGGPLALDGKLVGIVSWGFGCAHPNYPGVYTRVMVLRDWIEKKTRLGR